MRPPLNTLNTHLTFRVEEISMLAFYFFVCEPHQNMKPYFSWTSQDWKALFSEMEKNFYSIPPLPELPSHSKRWRDIWAYFLFHYSKNHYWNTLEDLVSLDHQETEDITFECFVKTLHIYMKRIFVCIKMCALIRQKTWKFYFIFMSKHKKKILSDILAFSYIIFSYWNSLCGWLFLNLRVP